MFTAMISSTVKDGGQNDQVVWLLAIPFCHLYIAFGVANPNISCRSTFYRKTCILSKLHNISACSCHVNCWYITHNTSLPKFSSHLHCYNCDRFLLHKDELKNTQKTPIHMNTSIILTWMDAFLYIMIPIYKC